MLNLNSDAIKKFILPNAISLVILDGVYLPDLSSKSQNILDCFANSARNDDAMEIGQVVARQHNLQIPANFKPALPIQLLFLYTKDCKYHLDIKLGQNSSCVIIEEHISINTLNCHGAKSASRNDENKHASSVHHSEARQIESVGIATEATINITAANNSTITYYKIQNQSDLSNYQTRTVINQHKNSQVNYGFMGKGVSKSCDIVQIHMLEERASFDALGAMILDKSQMLNYKMNIEHLAPNCSSNVLFKGVITDQAVGDFACRVLVHPSAYKTQTHVTNKNLLLSPSAAMNTEPSMEIYTDDVNCTHGATVGQLDQEALLYLRCRGIAYTQAVELLTKAFTQEIVEKFTQYLQPKH